MNHAEKNRPQPALAAALTVLLAVLCAGAAALSNDREQPIQLEADGVEFDEAKNRSVYEGNVIVVQGSLRLEADRVTVQHRERQPARIFAEGTPVHFEQQPDEGGEPVKGRSRQAEYEVDSEEIVLIGDAHLIKGADSFASDRIVYDRVRARIKAGAAAQGSERVHITITPPAREQPAQ